jgi:pyridoxamine 5'-phosphate oxidase
VGASTDPLGLFDAWLAEATVPHPDAVALATVDTAGRPSARIVILRGHDAEGFTFYTNYLSRKGRELATNPDAALLFHWDTRQVRIEGSVARVPAQESDTYWAQRPLGSRLVAAASPQSAEIADLTEIEAAVAELRERYGDDPPRPRQWGGYRLTPRSYEFWEQGADRLHDRIVYEEREGTWVRTRLAP